MTLRMIAIFIFCTAAFSAFAQAPPKELDVAVPAHDLPRGTKIVEGDLIYQPVAASRAGANTVRAIADAIGKETRRALRAGELIREADLKRPVLIAKGSTVTMLFEKPGMRLTAVGRAMAEGALGDSIVVLNPSSYRQVEAIVVAPGAVRVGRPDMPPLPSLATEIRP